MEAFSHCGVMRDALLSRSPSRKQVGIEDALVLSSLGDL